MEKKEKRNNESDTPEYSSDSPIFSAEEGQTEFQTLMGYAEEMHRRYFKALSYFYAFEALMELKAPNIVGRKKAEENVQTMSRYKGLFILAEESLRTSYLLELAKIFDSTKQALSINKVFRYAEGNIKYLTVEAFAKYNNSKSRSFQEELVQGYKSIGLKEFANIKKMLVEHGSVLEKLNDYRDKWLAHDDIKKPNIPPITVGEIKGLFKVLAEVLNAITGRLNNETWFYSHVEDSVKWGVNDAVDHLRRFMPYKREETRKMLQRRLAKNQVQD